MKKIIVLLCILICFSMVSTSAFAAEAVSLGIVGESVINSSVPNYFVDFTNNEVQHSLGHTNQVTIEYCDGYTKLTSTGPDPYLNLVAPEGDLLDNRYIVIVYRTTSSGGGEIFSAKNDGAPMSQASSNHVDWASYNTDGEWHHMVVDINSMCQKGTRFVSFRYDPITNNVAGAVMEIKCIAGFSSLNDANSFNLEEYWNYLNADPVWEQPEFVEQQVSAED